MQFKRFMIVLNVIRKRTKVSKEHSDERRSCRCLKMEYISAIAKLYKININSSLLKVSQLPENSFNLFHVKILRRKQRKNYFLLQSPNNFGNATTIFSLVFRL